MLEAGSRLTVDSAKREAADLRALLRFLYLDGILAAGLGGAMPSVATWRGTRLPAATSAADVEAVLDSCFDNGVRAPGPGHLGAASAAGAALRGWPPCS